MQIPMASSFMPLLLLLSFLAGPMAGEAVQFKVVNAIQNTVTGGNFDSEVGVAFAAEVLAKATDLAWRTLGQQSTSQRKNFAEVTLLVEGDLSYGTFTSGNTVHLGGGRYGHGGPQTFDQSQVAGILYREVTNVWQFDGNGHANKGLLKGIAELVQMRSGYAPTDWAKKGDGEHWDERTPGVTAQFLQYCDQRHSGFVAELGRKMKKGYNDSFFTEITGKTVNQLWKDYKASNKNEI